MRPSNDPSARHFWSLIKGGSWGNFLSTVSTVPDSKSKSKCDRLEVANMGQNCPSPAISTVSSESANSFPTGSLRLSWDSNSYVLPSDVLSKGSMWSWAHGFHPTLPSNTASWCNTCIAGLCNRFSRDDDVQSRGVMPRSNASLGSVFGK